MAQSKRQQHTIDSPPEEQARVSVDAVSAYPEHTELQSSDPPVQGPPMSTYGKVEDESGEDNSRFQKIETERYMYNATKCYADVPADKRKALVGYAINLEDMPPIKVGKNVDGTDKLRDWKALVVKVTRPTNVLDREGNVIEVPKGSEVLIPATHQIQQFLFKAASHPKAVFELFIRPLKKIPISKGGQTMWTFELGANPRFVSRQSLGVTALLMPPQTQNPALTPGEGATGEEDIPF